LSAKRYLFLRHKNLAKCLKKQEIITNILQISDAK